MKKVILIATVSMLLIGCTGPQSYSDKPLPAKTGSSHIEVVNINQLKRNYEIIGECRGDAFLDNVQTLKAQARKLGADAMSLPQNVGNGIIRSYAIKYK